MLSKIKESLTYDAETGRLFNSKTGKLAGKKTQQGYLVVTVAGQSVFAHRACWAIYYGQWPSMMIDHINHDKTDNRICNLREATAMQNLRNRPRQTNNTTGAKGVSFHKFSGKYRAQIKVDGKKLHLGLFETPEAAHAAYAAAAVRFHGDFACAG